MRPAIRASGFSEKRNYVRAPLRLMVHLQLDSKLVVGESIDLSGGGMLIAIDLPLRQGDLLLVKFALPKVVEPILSDVRVAHVLPSQDKRDRRCRIGLEFVGLAAAKVKAINDACVTHLTYHDREALKLVKSPVATPVAAPSVAIRPQAAPAPVVGRPPAPSAPLAGAPVYVDLCFGTEEEFLGEYLRNIVKNGITIDTDADVATFAEVVVDVHVPQRVEALRLQGVAVHQFPSERKHTHAVGVHLNKTKSAGLPGMHQLAKRMLARRDRVLLDPRRVTPFESALRAA